MAEIKVYIHSSDGTVKESSFETSPEFDARMAKAQEWAKEVGYWCTHEGRSVSHPTAYWWEDHPDDPVYYKHGVRCGECGGYIQVG